MLFSRLDQVAVETIFRKRLLVWLEACFLWNLFELDRIYGFILIPAVLVLFI